MSAIKFAKSEEERKLIRAKIKKSKKKVNVYFNKKNSKGATKYITGDFYSEKNKFTFKYRSSYELAYFHKLEEDSNVVSYMYEPFEVEYVDFYKQSRRYRPDLLILYTDGSLHIAEIKPSAMLRDYDVQAKASAAKAYIKEYYKDHKIEYKFITETMIFADNTEYLEFLKQAKINNF